MSAFASGVIAAKREAAAPDTSKGSTPPGVNVYVDALVALVPAEALTLHAVILGFTTTTTTDSADQKVTAITDPTTLKWAFWALVVLSSVLFLAGRSIGKAKDKKTPSIWTTGLQCLIPAIAFVAWTMLQKTTAFDAVDSGLATAARDTIAVIAATVLGLTAGMLGYKLDKAEPKAA